MMSDFTSEFDWKNKTQGKAWSLIWIDIKKKQNINKPKSKAKSRYSSNT